MIHTKQTWQIGDCRYVMRGMDADSVDLIVTDPPYFIKRSTKNVPIHDRAKSKQEREGHKQQASNSEASEIVLVAHDNWVERR